MFNSSSKIIFFLILMTSTMVTVSSNSWLGAWMGLEINLLAFIPLMSDNNNLMSTEASLKYFLIQALASAVLLFAIITMLLNNSPMSQETYYIKMIILSSLLMKSGAAPFHFWFPNVMEGLSWTNSLILMTWQKIAPLMLVSYTLCSQLLNISIIFSVIVGSLGGLNQTSLRKLMAFSSINHLGWMLTAMQASETFWLMYFLFYSLLSFSLVFLFNAFKVSHINQLFTAFFSSKTMKFILFLNLLSLGGLPPFLGFLPKWLVIQLLVSNEQFLLMTVITVMTLITLFFYLRLGFAAFMLNYYENSWNVFMQMNSLAFKPLLILSFISTTGLIFTSTIFMFI